MNLFSNSLPLLCLRKNGRILLANLAWVWCGFSFFSFFFFGFHPFALFPCSSSFVSAITDHFLTVDISHSSVSHKNTVSLESGLTYTI